MPIILYKKNFVSLFTMNLMYLHSKSSEYVVR